VIQNSDILACHDVSEGGLAAAVVEMSFGSDIGATITVPESEDSEAFLFSETAGCFVVEIPPTTDAAKLFKGVPHLRIGSTSQASELRTRKGTHELFAATVDELKRAWQAPMKGVFN
ncbi:MAG: AIR synthase-related protein, partial [Acidobacteriota bacterium]